MFDSGTPESVWLANIDQYWDFAGLVKCWSGLDIPPKERSSNRCGDLRELRSHHAEADIQTEFCRIGEEGSKSDIRSAAFGDASRQEHTSAAPGICGNASDRTDAPKILVWQKSLFASGFKIGSS